MTMTMTLLTLSLFALASGIINAQLIPYTSQPKIWHTFDLNPGNRPNQSRSLFSWARGTAPNTGIAVFNGVNNYLNLTAYADDRGQLFPTTLTRSFTLEYWIQFDAVNSWSRIFECGAGVGVDNINVANMDRTTDLAWSVDAGTGGNQNTRVIARTAISRGSFQHIVLTVEQQNITEITRGDLDVYVDGVLRATNRNAYLPRVVRRNDCWIGKSFYAGDGWFNGLVDDFFLYDHSISAEAVQAHYVLPRPPVYELTFSTDPRIIVNRPNRDYTYRWLSDANKNSTGSKFGGYLLINGSNDHIDLALTSSNPAWIGTTSPLPMIGKVADSGANGTMPLGWSIELTFTPLTVENWAKIFDIGSGAPLDNIILGYSGSTNSLRFEYFIGTEQQPTLEVAALNVDSTYHIVITILPNDATSGIGAIEVFVNGNPVDALNNVPMPRAVTRTNAYIGKSHWQDEYFDCLLDSFRTYDYSLSGDEVLALYDATRESTEQDLDPSGSVYRTGPTRQYTFRNTPPTSALINTAFQWTNNSAAGASDWHRGIAIFNGSGSWIDLNRFPDDYGQGSVMPKFGNSISFEVWARWTQFRRFSRIFDFGREWNSNAYSIILANTGSTSEVLFESRNSQSQLSGVPSIPNALALNRWTHIVVTVEQVSYNDSSSARAAMYSVFIDGIMRGQARGFLPFPTPRRSAYLGRSNFAGDENFAGAIDSFLYYDYALQYEQIAAHHKLYKVPILELAFSRDPRPWLGLTNSSYAWEQYDPSDQQSNNTQFHNGHLVLLGQQWVNLTATTGPNSLGTTFAEAISGRLFGQPVYGEYAGPNSNNYRGWSIEMLLKIMTIENGAKLFSCATAARTNEISIGWYGPNNLFSVVIQRATGAAVVIPIIHTVNQASWYHVIVTATVNNQNYNNADYNVYLDGIRVDSVAISGSNAAFVSRPLCALGRSVVDPNSSLYFQGKIDTLRFMDYALSPAQITELYDLTHGYLPPVVQPLYDTAPIAQYTFDDQPDASKFIDGTSFSWERGTGDHKGIARLNGVDQWINVMSFPDDAGLPFPAVYGNSSFSFEAWVKFDSVRRWARIFDSAAGTGVDNVLLGMNGNSTGLAFHIYRQDSSISTQVNTAAGVWKPGQWQHVAVTCNDLAKTNTSVVRGSATQGWMQVFVDGRLVAERFSYVPRAVERPTTYIGKSHWVDDQLMQGSIDSFFYYEYALSGEQVLVHAALPRPPVFDLSFSIDPRSLIPSGSAFSYSWQEFDPSDSFSNGTSFHSGHVVLNHTRNNYINLGVLSGSNSLGLQLPRIGGVASGIGNTAPGWSFEWTLKINSLGAGRRVMDWATGPTANNIILGFGTSPNMLQFSVNSSSQFSTMDLVTIVPGKWVHIVVTLTPQSTGDMSTWTAYVDGVQVNSTTGVTPAPVRRNLAYLGRSNAPGTPVYCSVNIDNIRVFDWVVSSAQAATMYRISHDPSVDPQPVVSSSTGVSRGSSSSSRRISSSSTGSRRTCVYGGSYPNCFCECDHMYTSWPMCDHCDALPAAPSSGAALSFGEIVSVSVLALGVVSMVGLVAFCFYRRSHMTGYNNGLYDSEKNSVSMTSSRSGPGYDGSVTNDSSSTYDWRAAAQQEQNQWQAPQDDYQFGSNNYQPQGSELY